MQHLIAPSILACDLGNLQREVEMLNSSTADWIHVDIMDGIFVPNLSFGFPVLEAINQYSSKLLDVHLMIVNPERFISRFSESGANNLIVHFEACSNLHKTIRQIKDKGMRVSVAINPQTTVEAVKNVIKEIDRLVIMSVNPGFGGQKFLEQTYQKVEQAIDLIERAGSKARIQIDGGVNLLNGPKLIALGATILVAGSSIFQSEHPTKTIQEFRRL